MSDSPASASQTSATHAPVPAPPPSTDAVVRIRGLPFAATVDDIATFFASCKLKSDPESSIRFVRHPDGRANGEAFLYLQSEAEFAPALALKGGYMNKRYIEIIQSSHTEADATIARRAAADALSMAGGGGSGPATGGAPSHGGPPPQTDYVCRCRGLPFSCTIADLREFFSGTEIVENGVVLTLNDGGRPTGEAFIVLPSSDAQSSAVARNRQHMGHRYIEVFESSYDEMVQHTEQHSGGGAMRRPHRTHPNDHYHPSSGSSRNYSGSQNGSSGSAYRRPYDPHGPYAPLPYHQGAPPTTHRYQPPPPHHQQQHPLSSASSIPSQSTAVVSSSYYGGFDPLSGIPYTAGTHGSSLYTDQQQQSSPYSLPPRQPHYPSPQAPAPSSSSPSSSFTLRMRGLPFRASDRDVFDFFAPIPVVSVRLKLNQRGQPSGEGFADFASEADLLQAMRRDREKMQTRYIELFRDTPAFQEYSRY